MNILAIDTASFPASAAILSDGSIVGESVIRNKRKHSQNIMVMVERLFEDTGLSVGDMDVFAVTTGPGSFTGLRIGIATVRAFSQACGKDCVGVNTLEALAYNFVMSGRLVVPMLDARRDEVFAAAYMSGTEEVMAPCVMKVDECIEKFGAGGVIYTGDGAVKNAEYIKERGGAVAPASHSEVRAAAAAALAETKAERGETSGYGGIRPLYLRRSQAEREYDLRKHGGNGNDSDRK